ncbi:MAG: MBL fold metallo-hydrolase [Candidatus Kerfeldbacteria bacterium]|nr:MBL fold metallo-hydrolase [Candidatus Kerfeldbacteria bacterium]
MYITWLGQSCFKIQTKNATLIMDPYDQKLGLKLPRLQADIVTISHDHYDHNNAEGIGGEPFIISNPGEYEVKGISIRGIPSWHDTSEGAERGANTIYIIEAEDIKIAHVGDLGTQLSEVQVEQLDNIDVLMVPVGGTYTLDAAGAAKVVNDIEPRIIIPMHYKLPGLKVSLAGVEPFCKEMGVKPNGAEEKLRVVKKELPTDDSQVVILKA